ncbi:tetratricopeptide repeat protein [Larkinella bovis]|uniref:histidine kinase n=1 Tax=Larkinella bovis TaxID=683041 RepID=A0ABW0I9W4_9BACT
MKSFQKVILLLAGLGVFGFARAQRYDTPPFDFDRGMDRRYVDSLLQATKNRLRDLDRLPPSPTVDTARMEFQCFIATVHFNGMAHRDSALLKASQLVQVAERKRNIKYQIKGLLLIERYYRVYKIDYPQALKLNYRLLALIESAPATYGLYFWRIYRNLGHINSSIGEFSEAVGYLQKSIVWFEKDKKIDPVHLSDLHRLLAEAYKRQQQLDKAEKHYVISWEVLNQQPKVALSNKAFLSNDLGQIYNSQRKFSQAVPYLKQSVAYWGQLNSPLPQADALADLAVSYLGLNRYPEAIACAKEALSKNQKVYAPMLTAYSVLVEAYQHQQDWKNAFDYQRLYNAKKWEEQQAINQTESLRTKAKFDRERLEASHRQEQLVQQQRYQMLAKQGEIDRLNHTFKTKELLRISQTRDLQHRLESQQLKNAAAQKQAIIKQLKIDQLRLGLSTQENLRNLLLTGLAIISLLGLLLLYYSLRLRRSNQALRTKNREIEAALLKGQTIERKRVATELHDRVSSLLGATKMTFQTIDADILPPRERKRYENSLTLLNDAVTQVQQVSRNLQPDQLLQQDLLVSLKSLVKKLNLAEKTRFSLKYEPALHLSLSPQVKFNLYVICLELCTNILRHAGANQAQIKLVGNDDWLAVQVNDDGIGMNNRITRGLGLDNIRERAETIGAQFWLESGAETGTSARVLLPLTTG